MTGIRGGSCGDYAMYVHCARCNQTFGPLGSWPNACPTPGCGDANQLTLMTEEN